MKLRWLFRGRTEREAKDSEVDKLRDANDKQRLRIEEAVQTLAKARSERKDR